MRSLFILQKVLDQRIVSVNELRESITHELEDNPEWRLDRKTVVRLIVGLQNAGLVKLMVFCLNFTTKKAPRIEYIGNTFDSKTGNARARHVIHTMLVTTPDVHEDDLASLIQWQTPLHLRGLRSSCPLGRSPWLEPRPKLNSCESRRRSQ